MKGKPYRHHVNSESVAKPTVAPPTEPLPVVEKVTEVPVDTQSCGSCISYNRGICIRRGGTRLSTAGGDCTLFEE